MKSLCVHFIEDCRLFPKVELHINLSLNSRNASIYQITTKICTKR